jgi:LuxR family maltose regulon positive regulatory protein
MAVHRAHALLLLATVHHGRRDLSGARTLLRRAEELVERLVDPGVLPALLEQTTRMLGAAAPRSRGEMGATLTERELVVLRLLATRLSTREISQELHLSVNTVRTQVRSIHRKLGVTSRAEAVAHARQLGLLPGANPPRRDISPR